MSEPDDGSEVGAEFDPREPLMPPAAHVDGPRDVPPMDPRVEDHLWGLVATYKVADPEAVEFTVDHENLVSVSPVGCLHCGIPYSKLSSRRRCRGNY